MAMDNVTPADLGKAFRSMLMKVAQQLTEDELTKIAYQEGFSLELPPTGLQDMRVHLLHKLEAKGVFSPKNPDGFIAILKRLPKEELVEEVEKYKQLVIKSTKKNKSEKRRRLRGKDSESHSGSESKSSSSSMNIQGILEDLYATAMTQASKLMSTLEELKKVMQMQMPTNLMIEVMPQVKKAIAILANDDQTILGICESVKKLTVQVPTSPAGDAKSPGPMERKRFDTLLNRRPYRIPEDGQALQNNPVEIYDDILAKTDICKDPPPFTKDSTTLDAAGELEPLLYVNVPPRLARAKTKPKLPLPIPPKASMCAPDSIYDSLQSIRALSPTAQLQGDTLYEEIRDYDEIAERKNSVVSEVLYDNVGSSSSGTGTGSGEGDLREWLPTSTNKYETEPVYEEDLDSLLSNPAYIRRAERPSTDQLYMDINNETKEPANNYTDIIVKRKPQKPPLPPKDELY